MGDATDKEKGEEQKILEALQDHAEFTMRQLVGLPAWRMVGPELSQWTKKYLEGIVRSYHRQMSKLSMIEKRQK